jgi:hypothetical protein
MKLVAFVLPFGRSRLVRPGNLPGIVIRASRSAAVELFLPALCSPGAVSRLPLASGGKAFPRENIRAFTRLDTISWVQLDLAVIWQLVRLV